MIRKLTLLVLLFCGIQVFSQDMATLKKEAIRNAQAACEATLKEDFKTLLTFTHPNILDAAGGAEVMEAYLIATFESMKKDGFAFEKAETKSVSDVVKEQGEYRCYVENYNQMRMNDKRIISTSYMIGFYNELKKKWTFVEAKEMKNTGSVIAYFPDFKTEMVIPENTMKMEDIKK